MCKRGTMGKGGGVAVQQSGAIPQMGHGIERKLYEVKEIGSQARDSACAIAEPQYSRPKNLCIPPEPIL